MPEEAEYDHNSFAQQGQREADKRLLVRFYEKPRKDNAKSLEAGHPVYKDTTYIEIRVPGSRDSVARPATPHDKQRFPDHYKAFKDRTDAPSEGMPLTEWTMMSRSMADELAFINIKTVEQLAQVNDNLASQHMGLIGFKQSAQRWLDQAKSDVTTAELQEELAVRDKSIEAMQEQLAILMAAAEAGTKDVVPEEEEEEE